MESAVVSGDGVVRLASIVMQDVRADTGPAFCSLQAKLLQANAFLRHQNESVLQCANRAPDQLSRHRLPTTAAAHLLAHPRRVPVRMREAVSTPLPLHSHQLFHTLHP